MLSHFITAQHMLPYFGPIKNISVDGQTRPGFITFVREGVKVEKKCDNYRTVLTKVVPYV